MRYIVAYREPDGLVRLLMSMLNWNTDHSLSLDRHSYMYLRDGKRHGDNGTTCTKCIVILQKSPVRGVKNLSFVKQSDN